MFYEPEDRIKTYYEKEQCGFRLEPGNKTAQHERSVFHFSRPAIYDIFNLMVFHDVKVVWSWAQFDK